jgi:organic radical activating enzyme
MKIDTLRLLVDWQCNLKCSYCCNEQQRFRKNIKPIKSLGVVNWDKYKFVCITGGEPLLFLDRVETVAKLSKGFNILYSNGLLWNQEIADKLESWGVKAANIGLHYPKSFDSVIKNISGLKTNISIRFHVWNKFKEEMLNKYPNTNFRFWTMDDCDRDNEERFVLVSE